MPTRRGFVAGLSAALLPAPTWALVGNPIALSAARLPNGAFALVGLQDDGEIAFTVPLPARGHAGAAHPTRAEAVVIARRPGRYALVVDCATGDIRHTLNASTGRHFYGHAAYSSDGHLFFTTENAYATGEGRIGVWDVRLGYERIDEFTSGGIGPHEIIRLPNGTLAVANGGIRTHPDSGREKLNLEIMRPNLSTFSPAGRLLDQVTPPDHQNSLRHIATDASGQVFAGFQWQGDPFDAPQLIGVYRDGQLEMIGTPDIARQLKGYVGSIASIGADTVVVTSPRGGRLKVVGKDGAPRIELNVPDVCGIVRTSSSVLATSGYGTVTRLGTSDSTGTTRHNLAFDNHLIGL